MRSHQLVALFERIRRIRRYGLAGIMSLGVDCLVLNAHTKLSLSFSWPKDQDEALSYFSSAVHGDVCAHALCRDDNCK